MGDLPKYRDRSPEQKKRNIEGVARNRAKLRKWYEQLKEGQPCADCGGSFHLAAMHWDHLPGFEKVENLARLVNLGSRTKILAELEKCELVCANCHAVRTYERAQSAKALDTQRVA